MRTSEIVRSRTDMGARLLACAALVALVLAAGCAHEAEPPLLALDPEDVQMAPGDTSAAFVLRNAGGGSLHWRIESDAAWAVPEAASGTTRDEERLRCRIDAEELPGGRPTASLAVHSDGGDGVVRIHMARLLTLSPDSLFFADTSSLQRAVLVGAAAMPLAWRARPDCAWLRAAPDSGALAAPPETLEVSVSREGLDDGVYEGALVVAAGAFGEDTLRVRMFVGLAGSVRGHVYHAGSRIPIEGAAVRLNARELLTGADGEFVFRDVAVGPAWISAEREGYEGAGEAIDVPAAGLLHDLELSSPLYEHVVRGTLTNSLGRPISHAQATVVNPDGSASAINAVSDSHGAYVLACVPAGARTIRWTHSLYETQDATVTVDADLDGVDAALTSRPLPSPFVPDGPVVQRLACSVMRISWPLRYEETVAGYAVERSPAGLERFVDISGPLDRAIRFFDDLDLARGTYDYRLKTINIDALSGPPSPLREVPVYAWAPLVPNFSAGPDTRWGHSAIFVPEGDSLIIFAGSGCESGQCGTEFRDLWGFDLTTSIWSLIPFEGGPEKRYDHTAVYDRARRRMVLFAGRNLREAVGLADVWVFDLDTHAWRRIDASGPRARAGHIAVVDEARDRMIVYGGRTYVAGIGLVTLNDVWSFDLATEQWEQVLTGESGELPEQPGPRADASGAIVDEPGRRWMVVHGGIFTGLTAYRDTWAFDLDAQVWIPLPDGPNQRIDAPAAFVSDAGMVVFHGGRDGQTSVPLTDLQALVLDPAPHWVALDGGPASTQPAPRFGQTGTYDPSRRAFFITGGNLTLEGIMANDVWSYCFGD